MENVNTFHTKYLYCDFPRVVENVSRESSFQFVNDEITLPDREYPGFWAEREPDRLAIVILSV